ncbi:MAG: zinc-ribbon domain-containing protein [Eudoraea sp.]
MATLYPELVNQWHPTKNGPLLPEHFTPGSNKKVWWIDKIGHEWQEKICDRVKKIRKQIYPDQLSLFED